MCIECTHSEFGAVEPLTVLGPLPGWCCSPALPLGLLQISFSPGGVQWPDMF